MWRQMDFFRKLPDDLMVNTGTSAVASFGTVVIMLLLIWYEVQAYLAISTTTQVVLDSHQEDTLRIDFDVSLPAIPCTYASVDVADHMGQSFINITRNMRRWRLSTHENGQIEQLEQLDAPSAPMYSHVVHPGQQFSESLTTDLFDLYMTKYDMVLVNYFAPWCPWCKLLDPVWEIVAGQLDDHPEFSERVKMAKVDCTAPESSHLCKRAFVHAFPSILIYLHGSTTTRYMYSGPRSPEAILMFIEIFYERFFRNGGTISQESMSQLPEGLFNAHDLVQTHVKSEAPEGCRIAGSVNINRVPGKFMLTAHSIGHTFNLSNINATHLIHSFSFGQHADVESTIEGKIHPFDGRTFIAHDPNVTIEHYMKVIGFNDLRRHSMSRHYEFSASSNEYEAGKDEMPAALFTFDISPLVIETIESSMPWYRFFIHLCALVGGAFQVLRLIESGVFHISNSMRKQRLGKLN